jgi:hypothetical protein
MSARAPRARLLRVRVRAGPYPRQDEHQRTDRRKVGGVTREQCPDNAVAPRRCGESLFHSLGTVVAELAVQRFVLIVQAEWQRRLMISLQSHGAGMLLHIDATGKTNSYNSPLFALLYKVRVAPSPHNGVHPPPRSSCRASRSRCRHRARYAAGCGWRNRRRSTCRSPSRTCLRRPRAWRPSSTPSRCSRGEDCSRWYAPR